MSEEHQNLIIWGRPNSGKSYLSHLVTKKGQVDHALMRGTLFPKNDGSFYKISFLRRRIEDVFTARDEKVLIFVRDPRVSWFCQMTGVANHNIEEYIDHAEGTLCRESLQLIQHYRKAKDSIYVRFEDTLQKPQEVIDNINNHLNTSIEYLERIERYNSVVTLADTEKMGNNGMSNELVNKVFKHLEVVDKEFIDFFGYQKTLTLEEVLDQNYEG